MSRSMTSRSGREKQHGARVVAGAVALNETRDKVLVVSSEARPDNWVLPKGGAESDETIEEAAIRETWEESGAVGRLGPFIGEFLDPRPPKHWNSAESGPAPPRTVFHMFELFVDHLEEQWPESHKRRRQWLSYEEAHAAMLAHDRVQLAEALEHSRLAPGRQK